MMSGTNEYTVRLSETVKVRPEIFTPKGRLEIDYVSPEEIQFSYVGL